MRVYLLSFVFLSLLCQGARAQYDSLNTYSILSDVSARQAHISRIGMSSLTGWAGANMLGGGIMMTQSTGQQHYFHQMNLFWNVVNLGIGIPGLLGTYKEKPQDFESVYNYQKRLEKVYLLNAGLDLGYVASGWALNNFGKTKDGELGSRFKGYGNSLVLQGGYLFVHDLLMYSLYRTNHPRLQTLWKRVQILPTGFGAVIRFNHVPSSSYRPDDSDKK